MFFRRFQQAFAIFLLILTDFNCFCIAYTFSIDFVGLLCFLLISVDSGRFRWFFFGFLRLCWWLFADCGIFWYILVDSGWFCWISVDFGRLPMDSIDFNRFLMEFVRCCWILSDSYGFVIDFGRLLADFDRFLDGFWWNDGILGLY